MSRVHVKQVIDETLPIQRTALNNLKKRLENCTYDYVQCIMGYLPVIITTMKCVACFIREMSAPKSLTDWCPSSFLLVLLSS